MRNRANFTRGLAVLLSLAGALLCVSPGRAALVALYTFDDSDTSVTGDGTMASPFHIELADASGNGNTAVNTATQLSQLPSGETNVYGAAIQTNQPGKFGQSHKFFRDPSVFQTPGGGGPAKEQANTTYYVDAVAGIAPDSNGSIPDEANPRSFSFWFNQEVDVTSGGSQDKLFGYGAGFSGEAFDIGLNGGGIEMRHFGGNIVYGSGFDFDGSDAGWHHLVVRVNQGATTFANVDIFLDNTQLVGTGALSETLFTGDNVDGFGIGDTSIEAFSAAQNGFQGWLDQFRIFDHALTAQEIADLFNETASLPGDFDNDGDVDGTDFLIWQRDLGDATNLAAWQANYGMPLTANAVSTPEPGAGFMFLIVSLGGFVTRSLRNPPCVLTT